MGGCVACMLYQSINVHVVIIRTHSYRWHEAIHKETRGTINAGQFNLNVQIDYPKSDGLRPGHTKQSPLRPLPTLMIM
jgi:hypothetical protein